MIVSPKKPPKQLKFRWDEDLVGRIEALAKRSGRSVNETAELIVRWALDRAEAEFETHERTKRK